MPSRPVDSTHPADSTPDLPRIVGETSADVHADAAGSVWQLTPAQRDLDSNVIVLPPGDEIRRHVGPDLDVLVLVLDGSGTLETEGDTLALQPGAIVWLPRRSQRRFIAGDGGLRYFSVHQRKPGLGITKRPGDV
ncbi:cupin domain-containing protein [Microbacterium sp. LRZ72]|uniref:cupin domain-containing protein n=1 Tax=Microbacterium sp. LRZ72 TaxID=2942481 RepID=UPI0029A0F9EA|nr:cupin domain-containing protein [Microbacterium sp. LRZ72]MDX2377859.1 cupin domain-containing protein [Microbacterium sp. LRZ72]